LTGIQLSVASAMFNKNFAVLALRLLSRTGVFIILMAGLASAHSDPKPVGASAFHFVVFGDMPYNPPADFDRLENLIAQINQDKPVFSIHVGDVKSGVLNCSTDYFLVIRRYFNSFDGPLIYTPGDNDWSDCNRFLAGGYNTRERLGELRRIFFGEPLSMGRNPIRLTRQADGDSHLDMTENATWFHGGITFATIHMVGADNNLAGDRREFDRRNTANIDWIANTFRAAGENNSNGVVLLFHADIFSTRAPRAGFTGAKRAIAVGAKIFGRPVLLINGDAHFYGIDNPVRNAKTGEKIHNITRVIVFGNAKMHAVRIKVDPTSPRLFDIKPLIINKK
jgi:hypothetical protein